MRANPGDRVRGKTSDRCGTVVGDGGEGDERIAVQWDTWQSGRLDQMPARLVEVVERREESMTHTTGQIEEIGGNAREATAFASRLADRVSRLEESARFFPSVSSISDRVSNLEEVVTAISRDYTKHKAAAKSLRDGPKSYDKRIAALEESVANLVGRLEAATDIDVLAAHRLAALEAKDARLRDIIFGIANDTACRHDAKLGERIIALEARQPDRDPLRDHSFRIAGPGLGGNDGPEVEVAPADPVSRDECAASRSISDALRDVLRDELSRAIEAGMFESEAVNRVELRARKLVVEIQTIANEIAEENL